MKKLLKSLLDYDNPSHLGYAMFYDQIVQDSKDFSKEELYEIINDKSIDILIRQTALYMIGTQWTKESIQEISSILNSHPELSQYIDYLLTRFNIDEAKTFSVELLNKKLITKNHFDTVLHSINTNIVRGFDPVKKFGQSVYEN